MTAELISCWMKKPFVTRSNTHNDDHSLPNEWKTTYRTILCSNFASTSLEKLTGKLLLLLNEQLCRKHVPLDPRKFSLSSLNCTTMQRLQTALHIDFMCALHSTTFHPLESTCRNVCRQRKTPVKRLTDDRYPGRSLRGSPDPSYFYP